MSLIYTILVLLAVSLSYYLGYQAGRRKGRMDFVGRLIGLAHSRNVSWKDEEVLGNE